MKVPRWGFRIGWEDFLVGLRGEANRYGLRIDDGDLKTGIVPLPDTALYDGWDLRPLAAHCRDLEPYEWIGAIRANLLHVYGRAGDVEVVASAPPSARTVKAASVTTKVTTTLRQRLRTQLFGDAYKAALRLDDREIAMREIGDAWLVLVEEIEGGARAVTWDTVKQNGLARDEAFAIGGANGVADTMAGVHLQAVSVPGAQLEIAVSNRFYLSAVILETMARDGGEPRVMIPLSWHHWIGVTLARGVADRATLAAIGALVDKVRLGIQVADHEWISPTFWWWAPNQPPEPFSPEGVLPYDLERLLAPGS